jgi:tetratricopeptide (TPR) repeat protein
MKLKDMLRNSIVIFIFFFQVSVSIKAQISDPTGVFDLGNKQYEEHNYEAAINSYKQLCSEYYSPELFLNLGNSYYKVDDIPNTILYYEKALKLSPGNPNILHNLTLANKRVSDKNKINDSIQLSDWFFTWVSNAPNYWSYNSIYLFIIGSLLLILYLFSKSRKLKKLTFYTAVLSMIFGIFSIIFSGLHKSRLMSNEDAIIFKPSIELMSQPSANSSVSFVLHEGTKVKILDETELWYEIRFGDGKIGWLQKEFVKTI